MSAGDVAEWFRAGSEPIGDPERRAALWRDLASGLERDYGGSAVELLAAPAACSAAEAACSSGCAPYRAYSDPLAKKAFLFAKIAERRGWFERLGPRGLGGLCRQRAHAPCASLRAGQPDGPLDEVRAATRAAFKELAASTGISPPVLDDMLWELGRSDPDLLGNAAGDLAEPPRDPASTWY